MTTQKTQYDFGIYNGKYVVCGDKKWTVNENYASKSAIIDGDRLDVTYTPGAYPQFKVVDRVFRRFVLAKIVCRDGRIYAQCEGKNYRILGATITFYRLKLGDIVMAEIAEKGSVYAAITGIHARATEGAKVDNICRREKK